MAMGAAKKGQTSPKRSKPAQSYKVRPAAPRVSSGGGGGKSGSSGKATMQIRIAAAALVAVPMAILAALVAYLVVANA